MSPSAPNPAKWTLAELLDHNSRLRFDALLHALVAQRAEAGIPQVPAPDSGLHSLAFNILLLQSEPIRIVYEGEECLLYRSLVITGVDPYGIPVIAHLARGTSLNVAMICGHLNNVPLAVMNIEKAEPRFSAYASDNSIPLVEASRPAIAKAKPAPSASITTDRVLFYTGPLNYIHDLTNSLSGVVICASYVPSMTVCHGVTFYGSVKQFVGNIPVQDYRVRHYHLAGHCNESEVIIARPVSDYVAPALLAALRALPPQYETTSDAPVVALAVRGGNRVCTNEAELLSTLILALASKRAYRFLVVGWLRPTGASEQYQKTFANQEQEAARRIEAIISRVGEHRQSISIDRLNGVELIAAIPSLESCAFYVAPCGTLNHLVSWSSQSNGVVYGPPLAVANARAWNALAGDVLPEIEIPPEMIVVEQPTNPRSNYRVELSAVEFIVEKIAGSLPG